MDLLAHLRLLPLRCIGSTTVRTAGPILPALPVKLSRGSTCDPGCRLEAARRMVLEFGPIAGASSSDEVVVPMSSAQALSTAFMGLLVGGDLGVWSWTARRDCRRREGAHADIRRLDKRIGLRNKRVGI